MEVEITTLIAQIGLPGAIAVYLIWWITKTLNGNLKELVKSNRELKDAIYELKHEIEKIGDKIR